MTSDNAIRPDEVEYDCSGQSKPGDEMISFRDMPFDLMREYLMEWSNMIAAGNLSLVTR